VKQKVLEMGRDPSKPYSEQELNDLKFAFRSLPTHYSEDFIRSSDIHLLLKRMNFERTPEQTAGYKKFFDDNLGGVIALSDFINRASVIHDSKKMVQVAARAFDKNGDGFISADEFTELMKVMRIHDPKMKNVPFEKFLKEADTNKDGKVSIEECNEWISKNINI